MTSSPYVCLAKLQYLSKFFFMKHILSVIYENTTTNIWCHILSLCRSFPQRLTEKLLQRDTLLTFRCCKTFINNLCLLRSECLTFAYFIPSISHGSRANPVISLEFLADRLTGLCCRRLATCSSNCSRFVSLVFQSHLSMVNLYSIDQFNAPDNYCLNWILALWEHNCPQVVWACSKRICETGPINKLLYLLDFIAKRVNI